MDSPSTKILGPIGMLLPQSVLGQEDGRPDGRESLGNPLEVSVDKPNS
jgi:hypothetical protein